MNTDTQKICFYIWGILIALNHPRQFQREFQSQKY